MSGWQLYDDEGYVLMSLAQFADGGHLYDEVYTQYGPLFYELFGLPFRVLGITPNHGAARLLTLGFWLAASVLAGLLTWRLAGRAWSWGVAGMLLAFSALLELTAEPLHPGGFLAMVMAALAATLVFASPERRYLIAGLLVATLGLTKINLGGFATFALAFALAVDAVPRSPGQRLARRGVIAGGCAAPLVLMAPSADAPEWRWLAVHLTAILVAVALLARPRGADVRRAVVQFALGAVGLTVLGLAIILAAGTSVSGLVDGVIVEPLGLSDAFTVPPRFDLVSLVGSLAVLALVVVRRPASPILDLLVGGMAVLALVADTALSLDSPFLAPLLAPVVLLAGDEEDREGLLPVVCLVVFGALQAYPVAGSQVAFGTFLAAVPVVLLLRRGLTTSLARAPRLAPAAGLLLAVAVFGWQLRHEVTAYRDGVALDAPGAALIRLPEGDRDSIERTLGDMRGCRTLVTFPGVLSMNLWSRVPPPSAQYAGAWMYLLDAGQQARIVERLEASSAVCVLRAPDLLGFWGRGRPTPDGPLVRWIEQAEGPTTRNGPFILTHVT
jgi:hypothetical protein